MYSRNEVTGWSTRELAEMVGTTVKAIRHYHRVGVLPEPYRRGNGYKAYGTEHLARLLDTLRMRDIGIPLAQIRERFESEDSSAASARRLIEEVDASIQRLQAIRTDLIASARSEERQGSSTDLAGTVSAASRPERVMTRLVSRHFSPDAMSALRSMHGEDVPIDAEFASLPADADEATIEDLASRMAPHIRRARSKHPMPEHVVTGGKGAELRAAKAMGRALSHLYNGAQIEVVVRALAVDAEPHR